jgi:hypothetical protein
MKELGDSVVEHPSSQSTNLYVNRPMVNHKAEDMQKAAFYNLE